MKKYSIIIPTLTKTEEHLEVLQKCIESVHENSKDYELILVDDGSTYETWEDFDAWDNFVIYDVLVQHVQNKGIAASWNDGLRIARGEYLVVINDDITVEEKWLDKLRVALEDEDTYMAAAPGVNGQDHNEGILETHKWFPGYCFMLKRSTLEKIGFFDEQFSPFNYEDTDYWTRILQSGGKLVRNFNTRITHLGGHVLHTLDYDKVSDTNKQKFLVKHGFDPIPVFYYDGLGPWETI